MITLPYLTPAILANAETWLVNQIANQYPDTKPILIAAEGSPMNAELLQVVADWVNKRTGARAPS